jgi:hypothetical protein
MPRAAVASLGRGTGSLNPSFRINVPLLLVKSRRDRIEAAVGRVLDLA